MIPVEQEPDRLPLRAILATAAITIAIMVLAVIGAARAAKNPATFRVPPPTDTLERSLATEHARGLEKNAARGHDLDRLGWIDRDAGIAEIPIDRAIEITVERQR